MITNTQIINPDLEEDDLYITDKVEQIRLGKQLKRKESGIAIKHVVYSGKKETLIGKETKDAFDETTVKKRDRNYVLFESKLGTQKRVDIVGLEKKMPKKEQKPYQKPQLKQIRPAKIGMEHKVVTTNIERLESKTNQYQNQKPQRRPIYSSRLGIGDNVENSYLINYSSKPNQYQQLKSNISSRLGIGENVESSYLINSSSKPNQYQQLKPSISYKLGIGEISQSSYLINSSSKPNQYQYKVPQFNPSFSFRLGNGLKMDIANIGNKNTNQSQKLILKTEVQPRSIRTPGLRTVDKIYSHSKKKQYLDNYQYLETQTVKNPRKKSYVKHIRFGDIISNPNDSNKYQTLSSFYEPKIYEPQYNELTYNPKTITQNTTVTTIRKNIPQLSSNPSENNIIKRISRIGPRTPAVKTIDYNRFLNKRNFITTTKWNPSDEVRKTKLETLITRDDISQPYETKTEKRPKITINTRLRNQPNSGVERIKVNRHRYQGSSGVFINNEPRIDNLNNLNFANSITTSSRLSRRNIKFPSYPIEKPSFYPSIVSYNSSTYKPETNVISKVEIIKSEIKKVPYVKRRQISEIPPLVTIDTNINKRNSIRAQYKKRK